MNWNADYVLTVGRDEKSADLDGWVTLVNNSGVTYSNAKLQLVAGQLNRVEPPMPTRAMNGIAMEAKAAHRNSVRKHSPNITSTRSAAAPRFRTTNRNRSACYPAPACPSKNISSSKASILLPQSAGNRESIPQPVKVLYRFKNDEKAALACRCRRNRPRLSSRFERRHPVRRRRPHRPHAQGRNAQDSRWQRFRRDLRTQRN